METDDANDRMLISVLKGNPTVLSLCNRNLSKVPHLIGSIKNVKNLLLKSNHLKDLPQEVASLKHLEVINLGNNEFEKLPNVFQYTKSLKKLHLFNNVVEYIDPACLYGMPNLTFLNLNNNKLKFLPSEINRLPYLEVLSLDNNQLTEIPGEVCQLTELNELRINNNFLTNLPADIGFLRNLKLLHLRKNLIDELPDGICQCTELKVIDIAANNIRSFPSGLVELQLNEFYCEGNNLLKHLPVKSVQEQEVFMLKEIVARAVINMSHDCASILKNQLQHSPEAQSILKMALNCFVCGGPFLNTWLECVQFVDTRNIWKIKTNAFELPIRGMLCSYKCFNTHDHKFFGIAHGEVKNNNTNS